tara:strand:- start:1669 stop:2043 length:375 start_codon:yes stop_codon:yes gene_type:complete
MNISERLKQMQSDQEMYPVTLPGLGEDGSDLVVYFNKLTVREDEKLRKKHPTFYKAMTDGDIPSFSAMVDLIILKCKDEEGNSIFAQADSMYLLNQDVGYITGIATAMLEKLFDIPTVETIEGN